MKIFNLLCLVGCIFSTTYGAVKWIENPGELPYGLHLPAVKLPVITLLDGREFKDCVVSKETYATISFRHAKGMSKVDKALLPPEVLALFPLEPALAKIEAEANAAGQKAFEARKAEVVAQRAAEGRARVAKIEEKKVILQAAAERRRERGESAVADAVAQQQTSHAITQLTGADIEPAILARAENYYRDGRRAGSGYTMVFRLRIELGEITEVPGWPDRWSCEGHAYYNIYDSVYGGSFSSRDSRFTCEVRRVNGRIQVSDFSPR